MLIIGLPDEYECAKSWVSNDMSFDRDASFSTFETTIRVLGVSLLRTISTELEGVPDKDTSVMISTATVKLQPCFPDRRGYILGEGRAGHGSYKTGAHVTQASISIHGVSHPP
ncbi:hypothetical protein SERLA73DRAFT_189214 [Serpula lacrymans var. lacrymans S7.3]|uniref:Uncharacterized protein n=1 Tax=Serpula lacrymans var. lacrymans (strain S7.3) TaxID=936435 RepID=F8QD31_SERL3|nr:hypothetical protein SERLA73DRAFT_189214 [Serpula lacrymans var. lacrymans S7.3]